MSETQDPRLLHRCWHTPMRDLVRLRMSQRLNWRGVIAESALPADVKQLLKRLVRRTRLWRLEKADVARDLVGHFEDALAEGWSPAQAIEQFGDAHDSAKLIRRAKKRQRPWLWHFWRWSFWSAVALMGLYIGLGLYFLTGSRNIAVDYAAAMNRQAAAVSEADRAWPAFRDVMVTLKSDPAYTAQPESSSAEWQAPQDDRSVAKLMGLSIQPGDAQWPRIDAFLHKNQGNLAKLRESTAMPGLGFVAGYHFAVEDLPLFSPDTDPAEHAAWLAQQQAASDDEPMVWAIMLPHISELRQAAYILSADARRAAAAGNDELAYQNILAILRLADYADEQNTLINQLVTLAIRQRAFELISELMAGDEHRFTDSQLINLAHHIAGIDRYWLDLSGERMFMQDVIQHVYTDDGNGSGHIDAHGWRAYMAAFNSDVNILVAIENDAEHRVLDAMVTPAVVMITADRREMTQRADHFYDRFQAELAVPMWQQPESAAEAELAELVGGSMLNRMRYLMIGQIMPALSACRKKSERYAANADGLLAGIALELYRREHGGYPDALDALVPRYLPAVPIDHITGGPLNYRLIDGRPLLYSVGADRDDDGGKLVLGDDGKQDQQVVQWLTGEATPLVDGDWIVWPQHHVEP